MWMADPLVFAKTVAMVKSEYFDLELRKPVKCIKDYYDKYNGIIDSSVLAAETDFTPPAVGTLAIDQIRFVEETIETFCKQSELKRIIMEKSPALIQSEDYGSLEKLIRDAISIRIDSNIGISFFEGVENRQADHDNAVRYSLGYPALDKHMDGGVARSEMMLVLAISGGGKSVSVLNFALELLKQRDVKTGRFLNCLYVSLELKESMIDKRAQMVLSGMSSFELQKNPERAMGTVNALAGQCGDMIIKKLRLGATANDIRGLIKEIEIQKGWIPDVIVLDYLDKLYPIQKVSTENIGTRDKFITEEFYDLLGEFDMIGLTASQLTKSAATVEVYDQSHQAGGAEKTRSSDWTLAIHLTDAMRAANQIGFQFLKTRSSGGVGNTVNLGWNAASLQIYNPAGGGTSTRVPKNTGGNSHPAFKSSKPPIVNMEDLFGEV